jgi:hypothetical protein
MADEAFNETLQERAIAHADRQVADLEAKLENYTRNVPPGREDDYALAARVTSASLARMKEYRAGLLGVQVGVRDRRSANAQEQLLELLEKSAARDVGELFLADFSARTRYMRAREHEQTVARGFESLAPSAHRAPPEEEHDRVLVVERPARRNSPRLLLVVGVLAAIIGGTVVLMRPHDNTSRMAGFAGHYVLVRGFDDPTGADVFPTEEGLAGVTTPGPATGTFDIDANGKVTAGAVHIDKTVSGEQINCSFAFDGTRASGALAMSGPGAGGQLSWTGKQSFGGDCSTTLAYETSSVFQIGIKGSDVVVCSSEVEASLVACSAPNQRIVATFHKQS